MNAYLTERSSLPKSEKRPIFSQTLISRLARLRQAEEWAAHSTLPDPKGVETCNCRTADSGTFRDQGQIPCIGGRRIAAKRRHKAQPKAKRDNPWL
jgi:hypothetical protein